MTTTDTESVLTDARTILMRDVWSAFVTTRRAQRKYERDAAMARLLGLSRALVVLDWGRTEYDLWTVLSELTTMGASEPRNNINGEQDAWAMEIIEMAMDLCHYDRALRRHERDRMINATDDLREKTA